MIYQSRGPRGTLWKNVQLFETFNHLPALPLPLFLFVPNSPSFDKEDGHRRSRCTKLLAYSKHIQ
jgi:hypothetical protein